ncbi:helix-turn-helix domain-containing protein [Labedella populi]|uniref:Helix-turn-helix domain-containing protein n=1 Tax=Labedella populi TaxID=2498850 RepID=A0A3S4BE32_9MICO|nr:helix-turn-helix domain-containing protein [Labedella populi]RWZ68538.1 helix-turn-helix domain-containing protein [Labedella populi]
MLRSVAVIAIPEVAPFEFGVLAEVFGIDRSAQGGPVFDFHVVAAEPGVVTMKNGLGLVVSEGLEATATADLVAVPAFGSGETDIDPRIVEALRDAERRGAWVLSVCSGAFALAAAGLLDGRRSTTHWMHAGELTRRFPGTHVDPDVLFVEDRRVITGAGTAAGIDACLHLVRTELGAAAANIIARRMVVPPQRDGGQAQFIQTPPEHERISSLAAVTTWMVENLTEDQSVAVLARRAHMSERTFARRFRAELGATPAAWLNRQRLIRAQQLLERTDLGLEQIADESGFGSASVMRHHFVRTLKTTPNAYRRAFSCIDDGVLLTG